jgi:hypothetical protein
VQCPEGMATTNSLDAYLADEVNRVASLVPADGRFGQRKVFVAALFAALQVQSLACEGCDLADLKALLDPGEPRRSARPGPGRPGGSDGPGHGRP